MLQTTLELLNTLGYDIDYVTNILKYPPQHQLVFAGVDSSGNQFIVAASGKVICINKESAVYTGSWFAISFNDGTAYSSYSIDRFIEVDITYLSIDFSHPNLKPIDSSEVEKVTGLTKKIVKTALPTEEALKEIHDRCKTTTRCAICNERSWHVDIDSRRKTAHFRNFHW